MMLFKEKCLKKESQLWRHPCNSSLIIYSWRIMISWTVQYGSKGAASRKKRKESPRTCLCCELPVHSPRGECTFLTRDALVIEQCILGRLVILSQTSSQTLHPSFPFYSHRVLHDSRHKRLAEFLLHLHELLTVNPPFDWNRLSGLRLSFHTLCWLFCWFEDWHCLEQEKESSTT